jgi:transposase-like protein
VFAGFRFPIEVIVVAVRWYLRYNSPTETLKNYWSNAASRSTTSPPTGGCNGSPRYWPTPPGSAGTHPAPGGTWYVDETYIKVNRVWQYVYRAVDQYGQVIDVLVSARRDADAARRFFRRAIATLKVKPAEVVTDAAAVYPAVLDELLPQAWHHVEQYANNPIEADHSWLRHRLRPMPGLRTDQTAQVIIAGHAFMQNLMGHYELAVDAPPIRRVAAVFTELAQAI